MISEYRPEWGSDTANNRRHIREHLHKKFGADAKTDLLDLRQVPELKNGFLSISHCLGLGGFVWDNNWIGLDIERSERVTPEIAARVAGMEEFALAPDPAALWCAKEAMFKSLRWSKPPKVIMEIEIFWLGDSAFELRNGGQFGAKSGKGTIERRGPFTLASFQTSAI